MASRTFIDVGAALKSRIQALKEWLDREHPECASEQKHLNEGTVERAYWHYGYMVALRDALKLLDDSRDDLN
jgi:hypothetical protein